MLVCFLVFRDESGVWQAFWVPQLESEILVKLVDGLRSIPSPVAWFCSTRLVKVHPERRRRGRPETYRSVVRGGGLIQVPGKAAGTLGKPAGNKDEIDASWFESAVGREGEGSLGRVCEGVGGHKVVLQDKLQENRGLPLA